MYQSLKHGSTHRYNNAKKIKILKVVISGILSNLTFEMSCPEFIFVNFFEKLTIEMSQHGFINVNFSEKLTKFPDYTLEVTSRFIKGTLKEHSSFPELTCPTHATQFRKKQKI